MSKSSNKQTASTWRKRDAAYRAEQKERKKANAERRRIWGEVSSLIDAGFTPADFEGFSDEETS